jgi:hypothetical protein
MTDAYTDARRSYSKLAWRAEAIRLHAVNLQLEKETIEANKKAADWIRTSNEADMRHMGEYELLRRERVAEQTRADAAEAELKALRASTETEIANLRATARQHSAEAEALRETLVNIGACAQDTAQRRFDP